VHSNLVGGIVNEGGVTHTQIKKSGRFEGEREQCSRDVSATRNNSREEGRAHGNNGDRRTVPKQGAMQKGKWVGGKKSPAKKGVSQARKTQE